MGLRRPQSSAAVAPPEWRDRATEDQLRRFMGSGARRKIRYARLLVDALDLERVPRPLDGALSHAVTGSRLHRDPPAI